MLFVVGWLIWLAFSARASQTPAKRLVGMYVVTPAALNAPSGRVDPASVGRIWFGEVAIKFLLIGVVSGGILLIVDGLWIFFSRDGQTLHDKIAGTLVVNSPSGIHPDQAPRKRPSGADPVDVRARLREIEARHERGDISPTEYADARRRILDDI